MQVPLTFEQSTILTQSNTEIESDSNIISYSQYMNESQYNTVQNSTLPALQDDLILSVIEQLKTQVVNCTKINQDNIEVNELLTTELERYRNQERVLNELKHDDKASTSYEPLKELFTSFDQCLIDEVTEVQNVFKQMKLAVEQHREEKNKFQNKMENVLQENDRLLTQALSVEIMNVVVHKNVKSACLNVDVCAHCVTIESELKNDFLKKECYETLLQKYHTLEKHCKSLKVHNQLKMEIFQRNTLSSSESAPTFAELFEINELKAQAQEKDTMILKLKEKVRSLNGDVNERNLKIEFEEIETLNLELDHNVTKLVAENEHLKQTYKQLKPKAANKKVPSLVANKMEPNSSWGSSSSNKFLGTVKFGNDHVAKIMGYGDYQIGNVTISRVYYMEGLGHNLFSVRQFCDSNLEVAFRQHTCFIHNLDRVDLLTGSRGNNLYTLSLQDMMASSPICLLSKASKTKSWFWHHRLSHLNFEAINHLARQGLVRGLPKLKFEKDHLCSACAMGKSTKKIHKPKSEDTNQEKLYLLHMDLCRPILRRIQTDNGTEFVNQTLCDYYEEVGISHETSVACSSHQKGVVERRNRTLIEAARTMLIYAQASLFLWAEAVATTCFTENRSIIRLRHGKTPYELLHSKLPDLSFFHVFGTLCYPINDSENLVDADLTGSPSSTTVDQDAPSSSKSLTTTEIQSSVIPQDVGDDNLDMEVAHMGNDLLLYPDNPNHVYKLKKALYGLKQALRAWTMATMIEQQVALDEALVPSTKRLRIGRSNFRLPSDIQSKESTLQVVYDVLRTCPFFKAFLVPADVPKIYM
nr:hypothetical protein [Tanacetum cinerariifolium]